MNTKIIQQIGSSLFISLFVLLVWHMVADVPTVVAQFSLDGSSKSVQPSNDVQPGETLSYTIVLSNSFGTNPVTTTVTDIFPDDTTYVENSLAISGTHQVPSLLQNSQGITWNGTISANSNITITYNLAITDTFSTTEATVPLTNTATISTTTVKLLTATALVSMPPPDIAVEITPDSLMAHAGQELAYTVVITNSGDEYATLYIQSPIPAYTMFDSMISGSVAFDSDTNTVVLTDTIQGSSSLQFRYSVLVTGTEPFTPIVGKVQIQSPDLDSDIEKTTIVWTDCNPLEGAVHRFDQTRRGVSSAVGHPDTPGVDLKAKWVFDTNYDIDSTAIVSDGTTIIFGTIDGKLYVLDTAVDPPYGPDNQPQTALSISLGSPIKVSPTVFENGVIVVPAGQYLYAVTIVNDTLEEFWSEPYDAEAPIDSSPIIWDERGSIHFSTSDSTVHNVNPDGSLRWKRSTGEHIDGDSLAIGADGTLFQTTKENLFAFTPEGETKWITSTRVLDSPLIYSDSSNAVIGNDGTVYVFSIQSPIVGTPQIYLFAFNPEDGTQKIILGADALPWHLGSASNKDLDTSPALSVNGEKLYITIDNAIYEISTQHHKVSKIFESIPFENSISSPIVDATNKIYFATESGKVMVLNEEGNEISRYSLGTANMTNVEPVIGSDGTIYISNDSNQLLALVQDATPTAITCTPSSVEETIKPDSFVCTLKTTSTIIDTFTYTMMSPVPEHFEVRGDKLYIPANPTNPSAEVLDFEAGTQPITQYEFPMRTTSDSGGFSYEGSITIDVIPVNEFAPNCFDVDRTSIPENLDQNDTAIILTAIDDDVLDQHTFTLASDDCGIFTIPNGSNEIRVQNADLLDRETILNHTCHLTVKVENGELPACENSIDVAVTNVNEPPIPQNDVYTMYEDGTLVIPAASGVLANDRDTDEGDTLRAEVSNPPDGLVMQSDGSFTYTPPTNFYGTVRFTYNAIDDDGLSASAEVSIQVLPVNDAPEMENLDPLDVSEGMTATLTSENLKAKDLDNDSIKYTLTTVPGKGYFKRLDTGTRLGDGSSFTQDDINNGTIVYAHDGTDPVSKPDDFCDLSVSDGTISVAVTLDIFVTPQNDVPYLLAQNDLIVYEDGEVFITNYFLRANDNDHNAANLTYNIVKLPQHGELRKNGYPAIIGEQFTFTQEDIDNAIISYQHDGSEQPSQDGFFFTVSDPDGASIPETQFNIAILPLNDPPILTKNASLIVNECTGKDITSDYLFIADPDHDPADRIYTIKRISEWGDITRDGVILSEESTFTQQQVDDGLVRYAHRCGENSADSFEFTVKDGLGERDAGTKTFDILINPQNDLPTLSLIDTQYTNEDTTKNNIPFTVGDADTPLDQLKVTASSLSPSRVPNNAAHVILNGSGSNYDITLVPADDAHGTADIEVCVNDGKDTTCRTFQLSITPIADAPDTSSFNTDEDQPKSFEILRNREDGSEVTHVRVGELDNDQGRFFSKNCQTKLGNPFVEFEEGIAEVCFVPTANFFGDVSLEVCGATSDSPLDVGECATIPIIVRSVNDHPELVYNTGLSVPEGLGALITKPTLLVTDTDDIAEHITFIVDILPTNGTLKNDAMPLGVGDTFTQYDINHGNIHYTHDGDKPLEDSITFTVQDDDNATLPQGPIAFRINMIADNDAPEFGAVNPITVGKGECHTITNDRLRFTDEDNTPEEIIYEMQQEPTYGEIRVGGVKVIDQFSQANIDNGTVEYCHNDEETPNDSFPFRVRDVANAYYHTVETFSIDVTMYNDNPSIRVDQTTLTIAEDTTGKISFIIYDEETPADELIVTASSGNTSLVPNVPANIIFGGFGATRTLQIVPAPNHFGVATITICVEDEETVGKPKQQTCTNFTLTVKPVADTPQVQGTPQTIEEQPTDITIVRHDTDGDEVTHFCINRIEQGVLKDTNKPSENLSDGDCVDVVKGKVTLTFTPKDQEPPVNGFFTVQAATCDQEECLGGSIVPVEITVEAVNDPPYFALLNNSVDIDETAAIILDSSLLLVNDVDNSHDEIVYTILENPLHGSLRVRGTLLDKDSNPTFTQQDVNEGHIRYHHNGDEEPSDTFFFKVSDGENIIERTRFDFNIVPTNDGTELIVHTLSVTEGDTAFITTDELNATDVDKPALSDLVYTLQTIPSHGTLHLNRSDVAMRIGDTFTQDDIVNLLVTYKHDGGEELQDEFTFKLCDNDSRFLQSEPVCMTRELPINKIPVNDPPILENNKGMRVTEGTDNNMIERKRLLFTDMDNSSADIVYTIVITPTYGLLYKSGVPLEPEDTFTQADVNSVRVRYQHLGAHMPSDSFDFTVSDKEITLDETFSFAITVDLLNDPPKLHGVPAQISIVDKGTSSPITNQHLSATDEELGPDALFYRLIKGPMHGAFYFNGAKLALNDTFSQQDVNENKMSYVHDGINTEEDSVTLRLCDDDAACMADDINLTIIISSFALTSLTPNNAFSDDGDVPITIKGTNFQSPITAQIGGTDLLSVTLENTTTIRAVVPIETLGIGTFNLTVTSNGSVVSITDAFTITEALIGDNPTLATISPNKAVANAGDVPITIRGTNFQTPITAQIGGIDLIKVTLENTTTIRAIVPVEQLQEGRLDLTVTSNGTQVMLNSAFAVKPPVKPTQFRVMVVLACDNDLESSCINLFNELELAMTHNPDLRVVVLWDGYQEGDSAYYLVQPDSSMERARYTNGKNRFPQGELNTGDKNTLVDFASWAQSQYPGTYKLLSFVGHGGGWAANLHPSQPRGVSRKGSAEEIGGMLWDEHPLSTLATVPLAEALKFITLSAPIDVLYLDACLMGTTEVLAEIAPYVQYSVVHENITWAIHPYKSYLAGVTSKTTPEELATHIANESRQSWFTGHPNQVSVINMEKIDTVLHHLDIVAQLLLNQLEAENKKQELHPFRDAMEQLRSEVQTVDQNNDLSIDQRDNTIDLRDMALKLTKHPYMNQKIKNAAQQLVNELDHTVVVTYTLNGRPWFGEFKWNLDMLHGMSLYYPEQDEWKRDFYNTYFLPHFAEQTHWDEFVQAWYYNQTAPPIPTEECTENCPNGPLPEETLELIVTPGLTNIMLKWGSASNHEVTNYRINRYIDNIFDANALATLRDIHYIDTTTQQNTSYCYWIEGLDGNNQVVIESNHACSISGQIDLWIPEVYAKPGSTALVPINIRNANDLRIAAGDFTIEYNPDVISPVQVVAAPLTEGEYNFVLGDNINYPGISKISVVSLNIDPTQLFDNGTLFWIEFQVNGNIGSTSKLNLLEYIGNIHATNLYAPNDNNPIEPIPITLSLTNGLLKVSHTYNLGDVNGDGIEESRDVYIASQIVTNPKLVPTPQQISAADINGNGEIDAGDLPMLQYYISNNVWPTKEHASMLNNLNKVTRLVRQLAAETSGSNTAAITTSFSIDKIAVVPGTKVQTSLRAKNLANLAAAEFTITYDPEIIDHIEDVRATDILSGFLVTFNDEQKGILHIVLSGGIPVNGTGKLLDIHFQVASDAPTNAESSLNFALAENYDVTGRNIATSSLQTPIEYGVNVIPIRRVYIPGLLHRQQK